MQYHYLSMICSGDAKARCLLLFLFVLVKSCSDANNDHDFSTKITFIMYQIGAYKGENCTNLCHSVINRDFFIE